MESRSTNRTKNPEVSMMSWRVGVESDTHITFSFMGPEQKVLGMVRALLWGGFVSNGKYEKVSVPGAFYTQYNIWIENNNLADLSNIFLYVKGRMHPGFVEPPEDYLNKFKHVNVLVSYVRNGENINAPVAQILYDAVLIAEEKHGPNIIVPNETNKPDDLAFWTDAELLENEQAAAELKLQSKFEKKMEHAKYLLIPFFLKSLSADLSNTDLESKFQKLTTDDVQLTTRMLKETLDLTDMLKTQIANKLKHLENNSIEDKDNKLNKSSDVDVESINHEHANKDIPKQLLSEQNAAPLKRPHFSGLLSLWQEKVAADKMMPSKHDHQSSNIRQDLCKNPNPTAASVTSLSMSKI